MNREQKIDYQILKCVKEGWRNEDYILDIVFKKFIISNFFRINKIYRVEIYNHLSKLIGEGCITR